MAEIEVTPASGKDWHAFIARAGQDDGTTERVLLEVHQRLLAVEAAGGVAGNPGHASAAPAGVSVEELADCLPVNAWAGPEGYSRQAFARHLLDHPRIGPLLRGEGAPAPKRVVLPEAPPPLLNGSNPCVDTSFQDGYFAGWYALRREVERQQGKQLPQTQEKSNDY